MTTWGHRRLVCMFAIATSAVCLAQDSTAPAHNATPPAATIPNTIDCGAFAAGDPRLDLVSKLCVFALTYRAKLPDFIAQQTTTSKGPGSTVVITAQVTYHEGLERYSQAAINGKPVIPNRPANVDLRLFTSGEFGPLLINLFEVPGAIEFKFQKTETMLGVPVAIFDFHLPKSKNTFWAIRDARGQTVKPEFHGHLWLEKETGRILREEVEPVLNAWQTGITSMKLTAEYSLTMVRDVGTFLLPAKSESTVCLIGRLGATLGCTTNVAVFHDYQKFVATSRIVPAQATP